MTKIYRFSLPLAIFVFFSFLSTIANAQKDTVKIGAFITSLYDFDLQDNSFMCDFWFWTLSKNDELDFENTMEIPFSKEYSFDSATNDGSIWNTVGKNI